MKNLTHFAATFKSSNLHQSPALEPQIEYVLTDIDDTITTEGQLHGYAYDALWKLKEAGLKIIPITGRPAGWCEMIARFWPVDGVVGENGGLCFYYQNKKMNRWYHADEKIITENKIKLKQIEELILKKFPEVKISSDQFCRITDLAVDFCEDVPPVSMDKVVQIKKVFEDHGAIAKISSIHVNGWFGNYNKLSSTLLLAKTLYGLNKDEFLSKSIYVGDSPNDEPMFEAFPLSFGVANVEKFKSSMKYLPTFIASKESGLGFCEIADELIKIRK